MNDTSEYGLWQLVVVHSLILLMFPVMVMLYKRLARKEEKESLKLFGERYARYAESIPRFIPIIPWQMALQRFR